MSETVIAANSTQRRPPPKSARGLLFWIRTNLFSSIYNTIMTLLALWALFVTIPEFIQWAILDSPSSDAPPPIQNPATDGRLIISEDRLVPRQLGLQRVQFLTTFVQSRTKFGTISHRCDDPVFARRDLSQRCVVTTSHHLEDVLNP